MVTPPFSDRSLFPTGFPANSHPVVVSIGYQNDIRMGNLQIPALVGASIYVPYTDRLRDGRTPFNYAVQNYIGGVAGNDLQADVEALVPGMFLQTTPPFLALSSLFANTPTPSAAAVATLTVTPVIVGFFDPNDDAYSPVASNPNEFVAQVKKEIVPNTLSGPSVRPSAIDFDFVTARSSPLYTQRTFRALINQPLILTNLACQRNTYYFNETFAEPVLRSGNVTLYPPLAGSVPRQLGGRYARQGGFSASGEMLGTNQESCRDAADNVDPTAVN